MQTQSIDLDEFLSEVHFAIKEFDWIQRTDRVGDHAGAIISGEDSKLMAEKEKELKSQKEFLKKEEEKVQSGVLRDKNILDVICPALQSASNDAFDIAKLLVPVMVPLVLAGTITLPLQPWLFGLLSLVISRIGINTLCRTYKASK